MYFKNVQAVSNFFPPRPASLMSCPYASPFLLIAYPLGKTLERHYGTF